MQPSPNLCLALCYIGAMRRVEVIRALLLATALAPAALAAQTSNPAAHPGAPSSSNPASTAPSTGTSPAPGAANPAASGECEGGPCPTATPHITIATPAPAPSPWPLQDRIRWASEIILAIIAYIGVMFALSILRKIERQTRYAETTAQAAAESAKAALQFAEAHARADRPWVLVSAEPAPGLPDTFTVVAANRGRGPARIVSLVEGISFASDESDLPPEPAYIDPDPAAPLGSMILLPGESIGIKSFRREEVQTVCKTLEQLRRVESWEEKIYLFGKVTYLDLQAPDQKQTFDTAWCCWYIHGRQKSGMVMAGPPQYNRHS